MNKIALIGYGYWGKRLLRYLEEKFTISYICHRKAPESGIYTSNLDNVLDSNVDAVVIATPINTHYSIAKKALEAGKHVLCEKPLSMSYTEALELSRIAKKNNLHLVTEFTYTFSDGINKAREIINKKEIGDLLSMEFSLRYVGRFVKFNVYWLLASHMLAVRNMFVPLNKNEFRLKDNINNETGLIIIDGKVPGYISVSLNYPQRETRIIWYCKEGTIVYDGINQPTLSVIRYRKKYGVLSNELIEKSWYFHYDEQNNLRNAASYFNDVMNGKINPRENLNSALKVTRILRKFNNETKSPGFSDNSYA